MRDMFNCFNRPNITYTRFIAHKLHLIICNSLNLWVKQKKEQDTTDVEETVDDKSYEDDEDETPIRLSQMIKSIPVDMDHVSIGNDSQEEESIDSYVVRYCL